LRCEGPFAGPWKKKCQIAQWFLRNLSHANHLRETATLTTEITESCKEKMAKKALTSENAPKDAKDA